MEAPRQDLIFTGQEGLEKFAQIYPFALRLGELSSMRGKGSLEQEAVAGEEFAHLSGRDNQPQRSIAR